jgi:heat shock protein HtpX
MASFFDAIESNKRNSMVLLFLSFLLFAGVAWAASYLMAGDNTCFFPLLLISLVYMGIAYYSGDRLILAAAGAKPATREEYPFLYNIVEGMALASNIPMPAIYIVDDPSPNAFATGRDPKHASVSVTTGLLKIMKREELEGVVAHEMSHIGNFDIRFMLYAIVVVGAIAIIANMFSRTMLFGRSSRRESKGGALAIVAIVFLILAPILGELIRLAISRQREYLADATAAKITRYPEGLASALEKIKNANMPMQNSNDAIAPLYISKPVQSAFHLFSTHPPLEERVKRLRSM